MAKGNLDSPSFSSIREFPTPHLDDLIVVERINRASFRLSQLYNPEKASPEYGRPWPRELFTGTIQAEFNFPDHVLTFCVEDARTQDMILTFAKDRARQDTYNYNIALSSESVGHRIYKRIYLERREGYTEVPELSSDPFNPYALCVKEEMRNEAPDNLKSLYVIVYREYEVLPGPLLTGITFDDMGNRVLTTKQVVALPFTVAVPTVDSSQTLEPISVRKGVASTKTFLNQDGTSPWNPSAQAWSEKLLVDDGIPGSYVLLEGYLVDAASPMPANTSVITYERRRYEPNIALRIEIKKTYTIPDTFYEIDTQGYTFPRRFVGLEWDASNTYAKWNFIPELSGNFPALIEHSFSTTMPTQADLAPFYIRYAEWSFPFGFSGRALTDGQAITIYVGGTPVWVGPTLPSSTPSAAAYPAGDPIQTSGEAKIYRAQIYHIRRVTIIAL